MIEVMMLQTADGHMVHISVVAAAELAPVTVIFTFRYLLNSRWRDVIVYHHHRSRLWFGQYDGRHNYSLRLDVASEPINAADETSQGGEGD
jgi:hypothetical protein